MSLLTEMCVGGSGVKQKLRITSLGLSTLSTQEGDGEPERRDGRGEWITPGSERGGEGVEGVTVSLFVEVEVRRSRGDGTDPFPSSDPQRSTQPSPRPYF